MNKSFRSSVPASIWRSLTIYLMIGVLYSLVIGANTYRTLETVKSPRTQFEFQGISGQKLNQEFLTLCIEANYSNEVEKRDFTLILPLERLQSQENQSLKAVVSSYSVNMDQLIIGCETSLFSSNPSKRLLQDYRGYSEAIAVIESNAPSDNFAAYHLYHASSNDSLLAVTQKTETDLYISFIIFKGEKRGLMVRDWINLSIALVKDVLTYPWQVFLWLQLSGAH